MTFFLGGPNIPKMTAERDYDGLGQCLEHRSPVVRLEAAGALAELNDGRGWRYLMDAVSHPEGVDIQAAAAEMLGQLGHPRAVPVLQEALPAARGEARAAIEEALLALGVEKDLPESRPLMPDAQDRSQAMEGESILSTLLGGMIDRDGVPPEMMHPILPSMEIEILSAQQHLDNAASLRENELQERGLVECMLGLWLSPGWAYAWYVRGVLLEDLEREREAFLAYRRALALDHFLVEAREALHELEENLDVLPEMPEAMIEELVSSEWRERRDGAVLLGEWLAAEQHKTPGFFAQALDSLIEALDDSEREVRHAVIEALGKTGASQAAERLIAQAESSWLLRISILQALSDLHALEQVVQWLKREMDHLQERNPVFTGQKDPLLELEYDLLMEAGVLALERTGDLEGLLEIAENNVWEEVEEEEEYDEYEEEEIDEDLDAYVDEPSMMAAMALERLAKKRMPDLSPALLERLAVVPDLTLLDLENEEADPAVLIDFSDLRALANKTLGR